VINTFSLVRLSPVVNPKHNDPMPAITFTAHVFQDNGLFFSDLVCCHEYLMVFSLFLTLQL
jgi:hypothetical protein